MAANKYEKLFSPYHIGKVQLKNRFVKTAAQTYFFESGENRVGVSVTFIDKGGSLGFGGLPAVMGAKNLKAVVACQGDQPLRVADRRRSCCGMRAQSSSQRSLHSEFTLATRSSFFFLEPPLICFSREMAARTSSVIS